MGAGGGAAGVQVGAEIQELLEFRWGWGADGRGRRGSEGRRRGAACGSAAHQAGGRAARGAGCRAAGRAVPGEQLRRCLPRARRPAPALPHPARRPRCVRPLRTVYAALEERGALALLDDPLMEVGGWAGGWVGD